MSAGVESHVDHIDNGITSSILADRRAQKFMHKQLDNEFQQFIQVQEADDNMLAEDFIIGVDPSSKNHSNFQLNGFSSLPGAHPVNGQDDHDDDAQGDLIYRRPDDLIGEQQDDGDRVNTENVLDRN